MQTPGYKQGKEIVTKHYGDVRNPLVPIVVDYGMLVETPAWSLAYEVARNEQGDRWGLTVIQADASGSTWECKQYRRIEKTRAALLDEISAVWKSIEDRL